MRSSKSGGAACCLCAFLGLLAVLPAQDPGHTLRVGIVGEAGDPEPDRVLGRLLGRVTAVLRERGFEIIDVVTVRGERMREAPGISTSGLYDAVALCDRLDADVLLRVCGKITAERSLSTGAFRASGTLDYSITARDEVVVLSRNSFDAGAVSPISAERARRMAFRDEKLISALATEAASQLDAYHERREKAGRLFRIQLSMLGGDASLQNGLRAMVAGHKKLAEGTLKVTRADSQILDSSQRATVIEVIGRFRCGKGEIIGRLHKPMKGLVQEHAGKDATYGVRIHGNTVAFVIHSVVRRAAENRDDGELVKKDMEAAYQRVKLGVFYIRAGAKTGTAFVISAEDKVLALTSAHVVGGRSQIEWRAPDGASGFAKVMATDDVRDLALLEILALPYEPHVFTLAKRRDAPVGSRVFLVRHSGGEDWGTISGVVENARLKDRRGSVMYSVTSTSGSSGAPVIQASVAGMEVVAVHGGPGEQLMRGERGAGGRLKSIPGYGLGCPADAVRVFLAKSGVRLGS